MEDVAGWKDFHVIKANKHFKTRYEELKEEIKKTITPNKDKYTKNNLYYDLQCNPQDYLPCMIRMMKEVEKDKVMIYNVFPMRNDIIPHSIKLDTTTLVHLLMTKKQGIKDDYLTEGNLKKNLHFSTGEKDIKQTLKHKLNSISFSYFYDDNTISFLEKTFPHSTIYHHGAIAVSIFIEHALFSHCDVWLNIHKSEIEILVKENNALMFYNMFLYKTTEDILYFLLFSFEQLNLKPDYTRLVISCNTHVDEEPIKSISKYIKNVRLLHRDTTNIVLPESQSSMPGHFYFTLFHQHLCVL